MNEAEKTGVGLILLSAAIALGIFIADLSLPLGVAGGVPYVVLVLVSLWSPQREFTLVVAAVATGLTALGYLHSVLAGFPWMVFANRLLAVFVIWATAVLGLERKRGEERIRKLNQQLDELVARRTAELRTSERMFKDIVEAAPDAIVGINPEGRIVLINERTEKLFGYQRDELLGQAVEILMPERFRERHVGHRTGYFADPRTRPMGACLGLYGRRKDGSEFPVEISLSPLETEQGLLVTSIVRDITERIKSQQALAQRAEELARSNAELERFAYVASHDLQEPLRMVTSFTQLLAKRYKDKLDADAHDYIAFAVDGATRMQKLINDLLAYSRVETRGREFTPVPASEALEWALANLRVAIGESGAQVTHDPLPIVTADSRQLGQLFQNLIGNAIKFRSDAPPRVHISARRDEKEWVFSVRDNGIGIDPQYAERVFIIFQRLHSQEEYPTSSTGIGLAICKRIVERHGGRIWVESQPRKGSTFHFTLPDKGGQPS